MSITYYEQQKSRIREEFMEILRKEKIQKDQLLNQLIEGYDDDSCPDFIENMAIEVGLLTTIVWLEEEKLAEKYRKIKNERRENQDDN